MKSGALPDWAAAVADEYGRRFPGTAKPGADEQLARLNAEEPLPDEIVAKLRAQRIQAVMDALTRAEGVTRARLRPLEAAQIVDDAAPGRIEFKLAQ